MNFFFFQMIKNVIVRMKFMHELRLNRIKVLGIQKVMHIEM